MKRKKYFNSTVDLAASTGEKALSPLYRLWLRFKSLMQHYPRLSVAIMFSAVIINYAVLLRYSSFQSVPYSLKSIDTPLVESRREEEGTDMGIPFSFENYRIMKSIQDTLSWLASRKERTKADTIILLRLITKMERLDPLFFDKIKKATHENDSTSSPKNKIK